MWYNGSDCSRRYCVLRYPGGALNTKQTVFVNEYLKCWNASEAARRAGYNGRSNTIGPRLLSDVGIKAEIDQRISELKMSADEALIRLAEQARSSMEDFIDGHRINLDKARAAGKLHLVKSYQEAGEKVGPRIELYDAQSALEKIGKVHGLFVDRTEVSGDIAFGFRDELARRLSRIADDGEAPGVPGGPE